MTYFYKVRGTIARKIGGIPPANEYVAVDPQGIVRHIKNGDILNEISLEIPNDDLDSQEFYKSEMGKQVARDMLLPKYRKKKTTSKPTRKVKIVKKCKCK